MKLSGNVAIVTGSGRGIGRSIALALAKEGAKIIVAARTRKEIVSVAKEIISSGGEAIAVKADVRKSSDVKNLVNASIKKFGKIDILVNNAGIRTRKNLDGLKEREWLDILDTNLNGAFFCIKHVMPVMKKRGYGRIINISSICGFYGYPKLSAYCASKFGLIGLTQSLTLELGFDNKIKIYAVCPAGVNTPVHRKLYPEYKSSQLIKPERVAKRVLDLCMPNCKIKSGTSIIMRKGLFD